MTLALDIAFQQLLKSEYPPGVVQVHELRSDVKGVLGLRAAGKQLADHEARQWMGDMVSCIIRDFEEYCKAMPWEKNLYDYWYTLGRE